MNTYDALRLGCDEFEMWANRTAGLRLRERSEIQIWGSSAQTWWWMLLDLGIMERNRWEKTVRYSLEQEPRGEWEKIGEAGDEPGWHQVTEDREEENFRTWRSTVNMDISWWLKQKNKEGILKIHMEEQQQESSSGTLVTLDVSTWTQCRSQTKWAWQITMQWHQVTHVPTGRDVMTVHMPGTQQLGTPCSKSRSSQTGQGGWSHSRIIDIRHLSDCITEHVD